jgi:hypothetical protein
MDLPTWRVRFPEFAKVPDAVAQANLDAASLSINVGVWLGLADEGQAYLAAHMLALSPQGQMARLDVKAGGVTTYELHYKRLMSQISPAASVL